jgi:hypothetical protein
MSEVDFNDLKPLKIQNQKANLKHLQMAVL